MSSTPVLHPTDHAIADPMTANRANPSPVFPFQPRLRQSADPRQRLHFVHFVHFAPIWDTL